MQDITLIVLIAGAVGMLFWGIVQVVTGVSDNKHRIQQRLSGDHHPEEFDPSTVTVVRRRIEVTGISGILAQIPWLSELAERIPQTWPSFTLAKFVFMSAGIWLLVAMVLALVTMSIPLGAVVGLACAVIPYLLLNNKRSRRQRALVYQLPDALDFLSRILRSGHSLSTGLQMMSEELAPPLAGEFRRCYEQHSLGQPLEDALKDAAIRVESSDFGFFVTAVLIQRQTGGDLSEVLSNISGMIRNRIRLASHVKAKTAEGRFTGYILVAFPVLMFGISYMLNPAYAGVLLHTTAGLKALAAAVVMCLLGLYFIKKITHVKV